MTSRPTASILVPTHDRPESLFLAVDTALRQTIKDLEVIIIGDGLTPRARLAVECLLNQDERVRLLDRPKSTFHGEAYRHEAILDSGSNAIFYLCDDDLLLPHHVEDLLELLEHNDLVQSLNGAFDPDGRLEMYPGSLDDPENVRWVLRDDIRFNSISLTGTAHRRDTYLRLNRPWTETPEGHWPDHFQWRKMLSAESLRVTTSHRMTALQFPASDPRRANWSEERALRELTQWHRTIQSNSGQSEIDRLVSKALAMMVSELNRTTGDLWSHVRNLETKVIEGEGTLQLALNEKHALETELSVSDALLQSTRSDLQRAKEREFASAAEISRLSSENRALTSTLSWRITSPMRAVRRLPAFRRRTR